MINSVIDSVIIGALLGDSHCEKNGSNCRIRFDHSISEYDYLLFKYKLLGTNVAKHSSYKVFDKRTGIFYNKCRFNTLSKPRFNKYREIFYSNNKKILPTNIGELLTTDLALLIWFLDDGSLRADCKQFRISTESFTEAEVNQLVKVLWDNYGLQAHYNLVKHEKKERAIIIIGATDGKSLKLNNKFKDFVQRQIPSMSKKFF